MMIKVRRGLVFLLSFSFLFSQFLSFSVKPVFAAQTYDMFSSSSYNLRFEGAVASEYFPTGALKTADLDGDGKQDILVAGSYTDNNSRTDSGSVYVIYGSLLETFSGSGNNIDLSNSSNYNLRFDGAGGGTPPGDKLGDWSLNVADLDNDGRQDIIMGALSADSNSRANSGSLYVVYNSLISSYSGTGNNIDLANSANYNLRFDGAAAGDGLSFGNIITGDLNNDGRQDILIPAIDTHNNSRDYSGSLYVIYNSLISNYSGIGNNIDLANSANYNLRFDGAVAWDRIGKGSTGLSDLDNDGKQDILVGAPAASNNDRTKSGSLYVIYNTLIDDYSGKGNNIDLAIPSKYNLRFDGAVAAASGEYFNLADWTPVYTADLNNDGRQDLLLGEPASSNNTRADSGCFYVIYNSLINSYSGMGNNINMANSSNYNLRFDGAAAGDRLSFKVLVPTDFNKDDKQDIFVGAYWADNNSRSKSGSLYVIYNGLFSNYAGTGNNIDMSNSANYSLRYDGAATGDWLPHGLIEVKDLNNDGSLDLLIGANYTDFNSRADSGSLYVIYNYPHFWDMDSVSDYFPGAPSNITGRISATGSTTNIYNVQYSLDGSAFYGTWTECPNDGGSYDSIDTEKFKCPITATLAEGLHKFYLRSSDVNGSYTSRLKTVDLRIDKTSPTITLTQVDSQTFKEGMTITNQTPTIFGKIMDSLSNSLAAGPDYLKVELKKKNSAGEWQTQETKTITLTENYWTSNGSKITENTLSTNSKYSVFSYTPVAKLSTGNYQLSVIGVDKADNHSSSTNFQFTLGASQSQETSSQPTFESQPDQPEAEATPTPTPAFVSRLPLFLKISLLLFVLILVALTIIKKLR